MESSDVVIVGAGHAGAQAALSLRQNGFAGSICLIGEEPELPYDRPPLSKEYLSGEKSFERLLLRPANLWREREVQLKPGCKVTVIDPQARVLVTGQGERLGYGQLVWAAGGDPRRLSCSGADLAGVHVLRNRSDVDRLQSELEAVTDVAVIGGGFIGLEAAAVLTKLGKTVTVFEEKDRVLARVTSPEVSRFYEAEHRARGVIVRTSAKVESLVGRDDRVVAVRLADGDQIAAQLVIVGIGIIPCVGPLAAAGATCANGVEIDAFGQTSLENVFAIGDCASFISPFADGARVRLESVQNANDQASSVARTIAGHPAPYGAAPWFWSNQFDLKLQTVGLGAGYDQTIIRGSPADRSFSVVYLRRGALIAVDAINRPKDYVQARSHLLSPMSADQMKALAADQDLKTVFAPAGSIATPVLAP